MPVCCPFVTLIAASRASFAFAWGDIPTWVTALVALLALIAAVLAYRKQSQAVNEQAEQLRDQQRVNSAQIEVLKLQQVELQQARLDRDAAQASQVVCWYDDDGPPGAYIINRLIRDEGVAAV